jgi:hypothetical protein
MGRLLALLACLVGLATTAHAAPIKGPPVVYSGSPCKGVVVSLQFGTNSATPSCYNGRIVGNVQQVPGFSYTPPTLSGTGATNTVCPDAAGVLHDFASGAQRITTAGVCLDSAASSNLLLQSQSFSASPWTAVTVTLTGSQPAPDGTSTGWKMAATTTGQDPAVTQTLTLTAGVNYTLSAYGKVGTITNNTQSIFIAPSAGGGPYAGATFVITGTCTSAAFWDGSTFTTISAGCTKLGNTGWYRFWINFTVPSGESSMKASIVADDGNGDVTSGQYAYMWGAQLEANPLTSYKITTTAAVSQTADALTEMSSLLNSSYTSTVNYSLGTSPAYSAYAPSASPINLGSTGGGGWLGGAVNSLVVTKTPPIPPAAVAAGFNQLTFVTNGNFNSTTVDTGGTYAPGYQWYLNNCGGATASNNTVTLSGGIASLETASGTVTNSNILSIGCTGTSPNYVGTAFGGGGYF